MLTFNFKDKSVTVDTHAIEGQMLYKAQDLLRGYGFEGRKVANTLTNWKISVHDSKLLENSSILISGRNGGTYITKRNLMKLAGYIDSSYEDAVYEAFEALIEGRSQDASNIAGTVSIDLAFADQVAGRWKDFCMRCHVDFKEVNNHYGSNITKFVVKLALGVSNTTHVKGKVDAHLVEKLVAQNAGAALLALDAQMTNFNKALDHPLVIPLMETREGKKQAYAALKQLYDI